MKRRTMILGAAAATGGALVLGFGWRTASFERRAQQAAAPGEALLGGWVKIAGNGRITVLVPHGDMGQGVFTALAMVLAEELDADWRHVHAERAPARPAFANGFLTAGYLLGDRSIPRLLQSLAADGMAEAARLNNVQVTGGSMSVRYTGRLGMRWVGAAARTMLMQAGAQALGVPIGELETAASRVIHKASGRSLGYGELAAAAAKLAVPTSPPLKPASSYRLVGTSPPRMDIPDKVTGRTTYAIDLQLPGMKVATARQAPVTGGTLIGVDTAPALKVPGVAKVLKRADSVVVIADGYWSALRGLNALEPRFSDAGHGAVSSAALAQAQAAALAGSEGTEAHTVGKAGALPEGRRIEATYEVPFLHHVTMEPPSLTARWADGRLTVWSGEQDALGSKAHVLKLTGLSDDEVEFIGMPMGGGFGRRSARRSDHLAQAIDAARATSPDPVKLIWSREEDFAQGSYRPMVMSRIVATLDATGQPLAWQQRLIDTPNVVMEGVELPYRIAQQSMTAVSAPAHVRLGAWRSVGHTQHGFYTECFMDELAHAAGQDPYTYRRALLEPGSRALKVLDAAAQRADWGSRLAEGRGRGIALVESFGSIVALVIEASPGSAPGNTDRQQRPRVHRATAVVDCGTVVHPDTARAQIEGGIVMGLSAAIGEAITIEHGATVQRNLHEYPLLKLAEAPRIDVHFLASDAPWGGIGEVGLPPAAPALANALFAATGVRLRRLPLAAAQA